MYVWGDKTGPDLVPRGTWSRDGFEPWADLGPGWAWAHHFPQNPRQDKISGQTSAQAGLGPGAGRVAGWTWSRGGTGPKLDLVPGRDWPQAGLGPGPGLAPGLIWARARTEHFSIWATAARRDDRYIWKRNLELNILRTNICLHIQIRRLDIIINKRKGCIKIMISEIICIQ